MLAIGIKVANQLILKQKGFLRFSVQSLSRVRLPAIPQTGDHQAPLSMGFSRQEQWSGFSFPSPEDLPYPGIKPGSPASQVDSLPLEPPRKP